MAAPTDRADLVIVGAGYTGSAALFSALHYLPPTAKVVIIDSRTYFGGHWRDQYVHVHLHQPYRHYTSFDQDWSLDKPPSHLACRDEVIAHLEDLGKRAAAKCNLQTLFEHEFVSYERVGDDISCTVRNLNEKNAAVGTFSVLTDRIIKATGANLRVKGPFPISSPRIASIAPLGVQSLSQELTDSGGSAQWFIIGSGKTAMDTILYIQKQRPDDEIVVLAGGGVAFFTREEFFPGDVLGRCFGGVLAPVHFIEWSLRWNGRNHSELFAEMLNSGRIVSPVTNPGSHRWATIGRSDVQTIVSSVKKWIPGRLDDVVDEDGAMSIRMQDGRREEIRVSPGRKVVFVNCTSHFYAQKPRPILQAGGKVLDTQFVCINPGLSAMYLTLAWFANRLHEVVPKLIRGIVVDDGPAPRHEEYFVKQLTAIHNVLTLTEVIPTSAMKKDCSSFLAWYPIHRQLWALLTVKLNAEKVKTHARKLLADLKYPESEFGVL